MIELSSAELTIISQLCPIVQLFFIGIDYKHFLAFAHIRSGAKRRPPQTHLVSLSSPNWHRLLIRYIKYNINWQAGQKLNAAFAAIFTYLRLRKGVERSIDGGDGPEEKQARRTDCSLREVIRHSNQNKLRAIIAGKCGCPFASAQSV